MRLFKTNRRIYLVQYGVEKTERNIEKFNFFVGREKKGQVAFPPLVLLRGSEGVVQNWNGKTSRADRRSVSAWGGLEWKVCTTSAGAWEKSINLPFYSGQGNLTTFQEFCIPINSLQKVRFVKSMFYLNFGYQFKDIVYGNH